MDPSFADRYLNEGFSGGEKKRNEILQMAILEPELADPRRDRLRPRHRRVAGRGQGRAGGARRPPRAGRARSSRTTSACSTTSSPTWCTSSSTAASSRSGGPELAERLEARGVRSHGADDTALDVAAIKKDFPLLDRSRSHEAPPRLPRLGRRRRRSRRPCSTRWQTYYETTLRQRPPRVSTRSPRRPPTRYEARAGQGGPVHRRRLRPRDRLHQERHRGHQPGRLLVGSRQPPRGRRRAAHRDGAPRQHRAVADAAGGAGHRAALHPDRRRLHARPHRPRPSGRRREAGRRDRDVERARHAHTRSGASPTPPTPPAPWCWSTAAQYVPHLPTDVVELGCDFLGFTGHKMLGPTGIGVLWAREELLDAMPAFLGGGEMIRDVRLDGWTPNELPWKFEAGTTAHRRGRRASAPPSTTSTRSAWTPSASTRWRSPPTRCARSPSASATHDRSTARPIRLSAAA